MPIQTLPPLVSRSMPMNPKPNIDALSNVPSRSNEPDFGLSGKRFSSQQIGPDPDRDVDREKPLPGCHRQDSGRDRGTERRAGRGDEGIQAENPPQHPGRIRKANQRPVLTHDARSAEPLNGAGECQHRQRMREGASERSEAKTMMPSSKTRRKPTISPMAAIGRSETTMAS